MCWVGEFNSEDVEEGRKRHEQQERSVQRWLPQLGDRHDTIRQQQPVSNDDQHVANIRHVLDE